MTRLKRVTFSEKVRMIVPELRSNVNLSSVGGTRSASFLTAICAGVEMDTTLRPAISTRAWSVNARKDDWIVKPSGCRRRMASRSLVVTVIVISVESVILTLPPVRL